MGEKEAMAEGLEGEREEEQNGSTHHLCCTDRLSQCSMSCLLHGIEEPWGTED